MGAEQAFIHSIPGRASAAGKVQTKWGGRKRSAKTEPWRASVQYACEKQYKANQLRSRWHLMSFLLPRPKGDFGSGKEEAKPSAPVHHTKTPTWTSLCAGCLIR